MGSTTCWLDKTGQDSVFTKTIVDVQRHWVRFYLTSFDYHYSFHNFIRISINFWSEWSFFNWGHVLSASHIIAYTFAYVMFINTITAFFYCLKIFGTGSVPLIDRMYAVDESTMEKLRSTDIYIYSSTKIFYVFLMHKKFRHGEIWRLIRSP